MLLRTAFGRASAKSIVSRRNPCCTHKKPAKWPVFYLLRR
ncbi:hypothetical protein E0L21_17065 [Kosakonia quasisacchari]|uniref:Uncharacterized protein n=1 Tax=Kosakonia quasisacchari TaxID=2529380 RepID=A0A4R0GWK7_9ENTR|nr:hypothetical protein E0L21_17065 [Kosakonia quasisacchari]